MHSKLAQVYRDNVLRDVLLETIRISSPITREQLLGTILDFFDTAIADLLKHGLVSCTSDPGNESHMDMFAIAATEQPITAARS